MKNAYKVLTRKPEGKRPWKNNIKISQKVGWGRMGWMDLAQDRDSWQALVNTVMNLRVP
jgi:hypothetical protein